jgi:hypothetical protein
MILMAVNMLKTMQQAKQPAPQPILAVDPSQARA